MNDSNKERPSSNIIRAQSDQPSEPLKPIIPADHVKRLYLGRLIVLILVAAIVVTVYLLGYGVAQRYEGVGIALCAVACGVFLVRRVIRLMKAEDKMQEQQPDGEEAPIALLESNPGGSEINSTMPPAEPGQSIKKP